MPLRQYCTDNAAMSAGLGQLYLDAGVTSPRSLDAVPFSAIGRMAEGDD
jgi:tRNA A37 threonylcarbamoyltransferase TsaD